jgi:hypothetical protein
MKGVALTDLLGLFATMFNAIGNLQNYVFAQITPHRNMTIVAIVISPPRMALQVMLTTAKVVMALSHQNHRVLLMTVKVKIRMAQRDRTQKRMKARIQTLPKAIR